MTKDYMRRLVIVTFAIVSSVMIGVGTNWYLGCAAMFAFNFFMWLWMLEHDE